MTLQADAADTIHTLYTPFKYVLVPGLDAFGNDMTMNRKASVCDTTILGRGGPHLLNEFRM